MQPDSHVIVTGCPATTTFFQNGGLPYSYDERQIYTLDSGYEFNSE
jgi:hypothetical protein